MLIIGCDYHPGFQQIAFVDTSFLLVEAAQVVVRSNLDEGNSTG
jgi:hypothetical protein